MKMEKPRQEISGDKMKESQNSGEAILELDLIPVCARILV